MALLKPIRNIVAGALLTSIAVWFTTIDSAIGWTAAIFFGCITVISITRYFKTATPLKDDQQNGKMNVNTGVQETSTGSESVFKFKEKGFTVLLDNQELSIDWKQVKCMVAYKLDRFASDEICMDVICDHQTRFTIFEETPGWEQFLETSKQALTGIDQFWEIAITTPAFETNPTVVYDWQGRSLKEIEKEYY